MRYLSLIIFSLVFLPQLANAQPADFQSQPGRVIIREKDEVPAQLAAIQPKDHKALYALGAIGLIIVAVLASRTLATQPKRKSK